MEVTNCLDEVDLKRRSKDKLENFILFKYRLKLLDNLWVVSLSKRFIISF